MEEQLLQTISSFTHCRCTPCKVCITKYGACPEKYSDFVAYNGIWM